VYPVGKLSGIIIKNADDLKLADMLMRSMSAENDNKNYKVEYDELVK